jgi:hypothetical protein
MGRIPFYDFATFAVFAEAPCEISSSLTQRHGGHGATKKTENA